MNALCKVAALAMLIAEVEHAETSRFWVWVLGWISSCSAMLVG